MKRFTTCLWFDDQAEEAVRFYSQVFTDLKVLDTKYYGDSGSQVAGRPRGSILTITFEMNGQDFEALNGGPVFQFNESVSLVVNCESQDEVDHYWARLSSEGGETGECGWLKDKFGLSWQIVPVELGEMLRHPDPVRVERTMAALFRMQKLELAELRRAFEGRD